MTEQTETQAKATKNDLARRWGVVGLGVAVAAAVVVKGFSKEDETIDVEVELDPELDDHPEEVEVVIEQE